MSRITRCCETRCHVVRIFAFGGISLRPVRHLRATAYLRKVHTGRTKPAIFQCDDLGGNDVGQFVVKLKGGLENGVTGLTCELLSSLVAGELGVMTVPLALIEIDPALSQVISEKDSDMRKIVKNSAGVNFATEVLVGGYGTWPVDKAIPISARQLASEIFSFDALIQNPDRRVNNPNLLWKDDEIFVIRIGPIQLEHCEFRIVLYRYTFVAETSVNLIDALHATN